MPTILWMQGITTAEFYETASKFRTGELAGYKQVAIESVNQLTGGLGDELGFHDLPYVSINLLQLLGGGLGENRLYPSL